MLLSVNNSFLRKGNPNIVGSWSHVSSFCLINSAAIQRRTNYDLKEGLEK
jgi:hypothetical protein